MTERGYNPEYEQTIKRIDGVAEKGRRWFVTRLFGISYLVIALGVGLGGAYEADSTESVVETETYIDLVSGFDSTYELIASFLVVPAILFGDVFGRFWHEYLLWIPPSVVNVALQGLAIVPLVLVAAAIMAFVRQYRKNRGVEL